jgi:hypothetical protein
MNTKVGSFALATLVALSGSEAKRSMAVTKEMEKIFSDFRNKDKFFMSHLSCRQDCSFEFWWKRQIGSKTLKDRNFPNFLLERSTIKS